MLCLPYNPMFLANDCASAMVWPSLMNNRTAPASPSTFPVANPW